MPGPFDFIRLAALAAFLALVAVGLWLLDVAWWVIPPVMVVALLVAWTIEWLAWRQRPLGVPPVSLEQPEPVPTAVVEPELPPAEALQPPVPAKPEPAAPPPPAPEPTVVMPPRPAPEPEVEPEPQAPPEPDAPPASEPVSPPAPEPVAAPEPAAEEPKPRRSRRVRLRSVPSPRQAEPAAQPAPPSAAESSVVPFVPRAYEPRQWNLWDLERIAREQRTNHPERHDEWAYLFLHLRQFAHADGSLPAEFDGLVRETFGGLLEPSTRP